VAGKDDAMARRRGTTTSNFGVGARESHDSSPFYDRFHPPMLSDDDKVRRPDEVSALIGDPFKTGDARTMAEIPDGSVALVVTSPPYFAGKQYEEDVEREVIPATYLEYLEMLRDVFADCVRVLEPGGRIAVNVANLGRKPYRSLSADVIRILQDDLGLLLRGELIWQKGEGASSSCAWGSFNSATNPVLRDITERVVVASKGRFDRALSVRARRDEGYPWDDAVGENEDFMAWTLDVWDVPPESATRVGHPAPFPVELPEKLIRLYTFADDLVLDPFMGSGSTLVAAALCRRRYVGYDLDPNYVAISRNRVEQIKSPEPKHTAPPAERTHVEATFPIDAPDTTDGNFQRRATLEGKTARKLAEHVLEEAGFRITGRNRRIRGTGVTVNFIALDRNDAQWFFDVSGAFTTHRGGLLRIDTVWKSLGRAFALKESRREIPLVFLTSHLPRPKSEGDTALRSAGPNAFFDAIDMLAGDARSRLERYAAGRQTESPQPGFWTPSELDRFEPFSASQ
jgi:site-specific DNA-methyltransferase (adenine-specific)